MKNILGKSKFKKNTLIKLRKGEIRLDVKKSKEDDDYSANIYAEYEKKRSMASPGPISKKTVDILSSTHLNIYNEFNDNIKEVQEEYNQIENTNQTGKNKNNISPRYRPRKSVFFINTSKKSTKKSEPKEKENFNISKYIGKKVYESDNDDDEDNKTNILFPMKEEEQNNNNENKTNKKTKISKLIDDNEEPPIQPIVKICNLKIFYEGKGITIKIPKEEKFSNCLSVINKILFPYHKLSDYDILYKLKVLDTKSLMDKKLSSIVGPSSKSATFYLRKNEKKVLKDEKLTTVLVENFPSFTDLANELNKFFENEKRESNFSVDYKGNICKVNFTESEKAFSLVIYLSNLKKSNPIFKRLKINMDYKINVVLNAKKSRQKPIKIFLPLIENNNIKVNKSIATNRKNKKLYDTKNNYNYNSNNSINKNNNYTINSPAVSRGRKKFDSCPTYEDKNILKSESKLIKKIKILGNNENNYDKINISEDSDDIMSKIKSTYSISDKNKNKKNNELNHEEDNIFSTKIKPLKKSNYYEIRTKSISEKNKDLFSKIKSRNSFSFY